MDGLIQTRLRQLADDCEERARRAHTGEARSLYHRAASDARRATRDRCLGDDGRRAALIAAAAQADWAGWYEGESFLDPQNSDFVSAMLDNPSTMPAKPLDIRDLPTDNLSVLPPDALNARQLADRLGMGERTARRAIERHWRKGWPGFYRDGRRWYAEPDAFDRAQRR